MSVGAHSSESYSPSEYESQLNPSLVPSPRGGKIVRRDVVERLAKSDNDRRTLSAMDLNGVLRFNLRIKAGSRCLIGRGSFATSPAGG